LLKTGLHVYVGTGACRQLPTTSLFSKKFCIFHNYFDMVNHNDQNP